MTQTPQGSNPTSTEGLEAILQYYFDWLLGHSDEELRNLDPRKAIDEAVDRIDRYASAKAKAELEKTYNDLRTMYPDEALKHMADRIAALDGGGGENQ